jgi:hypothetical protein
MKKLLSILVFLSFAVIATAQVPVTGGLAGTNNSIAVATLAATGRAVAATSYVFEIKAPSPWFYEWSVRLMQKSATVSKNTATIMFYGALENASGAYKQIGSTLTWAGSTTDTCAVVSSTGATVANALNWRFLKVTITPSDTVWIDHVLFNCLPSVPILTSITPGR